MGDAGGNASPDRLTRNGESPCGVSTLDDTLDALDGPRMSFASLSACGSGRGVWNTLKNILARLQNDVDPHDTVRSTE